MAEQDQSSINYQAIEFERLSEFQKTITEKLDQAREPAGFVGGSLRQSVLNDVVEGNYQKAQSRIEYYSQDRHQFHNFQLRSARLRKHSADLIVAIETKRNFQGLATLPLAKQQELYEKVLDHFEELKISLKNIERMDKEIRLDDIRSTTWVLKSLANSAFFIFVLALLIDIKVGLAESFGVVFDAFVTDLTNGFIRFIGW